MWCLMGVAQIITLIKSTQGGYEYPKPSVPFELHGQTLQTVAEEIPKGIAYFLPYNENQYLQQPEIKESLHTIGESAKLNYEIGITQEQPHSLLSKINTNIGATVSVHSAVSESPTIKELDFISDPQLPSSFPQLILNIENKVPPLINLQNNEYTQNVHENSNVKVLDNQNVENISGTKDYLPPLINLNSNQISSVDVSESIIPDIELQLNDHSSGVHHDVPISPQNVNNVIGTVEPHIINLEEPLPSLLDVQNVAQITSLTGIQNIYKKFPNNQLFFPSNEQIQLLRNENSLAEIVTPVITKSISVHVPPPDIEETPVLPTVSPPKKIIKIIFIKTPTYEKQYNQQLQSALYSRLTPAEDKTIIFVLVKKPEVLSVPIIPPQPTKVSEHEVFYVKYTGDETAKQEIIDESISPLPSAEDVPLEPIHLDEH